MGVALPLYGNGSQTLHTVLATRHTSAAQLLRCTRNSTSCTSTRPTTRASSCSPRSCCLQGTIGVGHLPLRIHSGPCSRSRARAHAGLAQPPARPHRRLGRLHRAARPLLPGIHLARHPERHRRGSLRARRGADRGAARERRSGHPLPRPLRSPQRPRDHARRVQRGLAGARGQGTTVHRRRRSAAQVLPEPARAGGRRFRALGRAHRLEPAALLRLGRRLLHALPARELRHGAARGHELRSPRGREPDLRLRAAAHERPRRPARRARGRSGRVRLRTPAPAGRPARAEPHGSRGACHAQRRAMPGARWPQNSRRTTSSCAARRLRASSCPLPRRARRRHASDTMRSWRDSPPPGCLRSSGWG